MQSRVAEKDEAFKQTRDDVRNQKITVRVLAQLGVFLRSDKIGGYESLDKGKQNRP